MKWVQLSSAQKQKFSKEKQNKILKLERKTAKLTNFFTQVPQHDTQILHQKQLVNLGIDAITSESKIDDIRNIEA